MEEYSGAKFQVIFQKKIIIDNPKICELKKWGKKLSDLGFIQHYKNETEPERLSSAGNLSFRCDNGFIITASYSDLANLRDTDFVEVSKANLHQKKIYVNGFREPSSETMLHYAIYQKRNDINAIFHGHGQKLLRNYEKLGLKSTKYFAPYGSMQLVNSVIEVLGNENFLIMKYHGFLSLGDTTNNAGKYVEDVYKRLMEIRVM
ncbi:MAG: class II aldolase/adducin family protein [Candidatus Cloacimonadota bacterium]|nr:class II aldolase/adducin family protein [Candidatus Cloacimonadota bacterium]